MKTKIFVSAAAIGLALLLLQKRVTPTPESPVATLKKATTPAPQPELKANPHEYLSASPPIPIIKQPDVRSLNDALQIDKKALKTIAETNAYEKALQDRELITSAARVLTSLHEPRGLQDRLENQRQRMDAALFLTRAVEWKKNPQAADVKRTMKLIVLDDLTSKTTDIELRKSLVADRIELFANLKAVDRPYANEIQASATREQSKKIIQFANNFYRLDESGKRAL